MSRSAKYQQDLNAMPEQAYKRMVINEADINQLFNSLDTDKSGTLDINEARAFFVGKYNLNETSLKLVFEKYDDNKNGTLDREEFRCLCLQINKTVDAFAEAEMKYMTDYLEFAMPYTTFAFCCCLCTLCTSWTCAAYCIEKRSLEVLERAKTTEERLNEEVLKDLKKGLHMDDRDDSRPVEAVPLKEEEN